MKTPGTRHQALGTRKKKQKRSEDVARHERKAAKVLLAGGAIALALHSGACTPTREVYRQDPRGTVDLNYRFDEDDARMVAERMIDECLDSGWIDSWLAGHAGNRPVMIVGTVKNDTSDYIDTKLFTKQIERSLLGSGRIRLVAARDERGEMRDERLEIKDWSRPETVKQMAYELGADLMLIGRVGESVEVSRGGAVRVQYYQVDMELIDIESNEKVWIGEKQIEKHQVDRN